MTLYDQYRNPVRDHHVKLISSRSQDTIDILQEGVTDNNGRANFKISSKFPGISVFTAMDATVNQVLQNREEVVFFAPSVPVADSPFAASLFAADIGGDGEVLPGPIDHFDIEGLPSTVKVGEELSMTVVSRDNNGNVAKNYTGTILISVPDDENAILPNNGEYTFIVSDQGQFTFDLSLQFSKVGAQAVQIFDKNNFRISGEHALEVIPKQGFIPGPTSPDLIIKSPADGAEMGSNLIILTGQGNENINLKVFDNDVKIGDTETDGDGFFSFEAKNLESGSHTFYVMSGAGEVSRAVTIRIDTLAPVLNAFEIDPEGIVLPGDQITVTLQSEPNLEEAKLRIQGVEEPMDESISEPGTYSATVVAPVQDGNFSVDVILMDSLSNKSEFLNKGTVTVESPMLKKPPKSEGLEGEPGDTVIQLTWNPVEDHERPIQRYRIYYGTSFDKLDQTVDTIDSAATWELRDLINDTQYFIAVKAVDTQGLESEEFSVTIAVTPVTADLCLDVDCGDYGVCGEEGVCQCLDGFSGENCEIAPVAPIDGQIQATPYDGAVTLIWKPFFGVRAYYYKVFMGFVPGQYSDYVFTSDNRTTVTVPDLINNMPYYFAVAALDVNGAQVSQLSGEVQATPTGIGFRPAAPSPVPFDAGYTQYPAAGYQPDNFDQGVYRDQLAKVPQTDETGPEVIWVILASLTFAYFFYRHKRKLILKHQNKMSNV